MSWQQSAKSPHLAHSKSFNELTHPLCYQCVTASLAILCSFSFAQGNLFNHIQPLFKKKGGGGKGTLAMSYSPIKSPQTALFLFINSHRASSLEPLIHSPYASNSPAAPVYLLDATLHDENSDGPETWYKV
jgi:hypothetical protein